MRPKATPYFLQREAMLAGGFDVQQYHGTIGKNAILRNKKELESVFGIASGGRKGGLNVHRLTLP
jgi:hypothetical protein